MAYIPQICLLDEPTRGIDIEAKESILNTVHCELRKQSCIITTSSGAEDLIKICDRTLVLYEGEIIDQFSRGEPFEKQTYRAIQGEVTHINEVRKS